MCANSERGLAIVFGISHYLNGIIRIKSIAEHYLFCLRINAQRTVFVHYLHQLFIIVSTVYTQSLEQVGEVFGEVQTEYIPTETVIKECAKRAAESVSPCVHGNVVRHLRTVHSTDGAYKLMSHGANRQQIMFHGEIYVACSYELSGPVTASATVFKCLYGGVFCFK